MHFFFIALLPVVYATTVDVPAWESSIQSLAAAIQTAHGAARSSLLSQFNSLGVMPGVVASDPRSVVTQAVSGSTTPTEPYASYHSWESAMLSIAQSIATASGTDRAHDLSQYSALQATPGVIPAAESSSVSPLTVGPSTGTVVAFSSGTASTSADTSLATPGPSDAIPSSNSAVSTPTSGKSSNSVMSVSSSGTEAASSSKGGAVPVLPPVGGVAGFVLGLAALL